MPGTVGLTVRIYGHNHFVLLIAENAFTLLVENDSEEIAGLSMVVPRLPKSCNPTVCCSH